MNKLNFIRTTLSALDKDIKALVEKYGSNPNGNAVNALVKKYETILTSGGMVNILPIPKTNLVTG
ncbi:hypothetical protein 310Ecol104PP_00148 [Escherichia phage 310Ecol104PP]|nr:hypothetical protein 310Ecol104PP_00148 [Escherichia phage 310Ecol104PP]